jgi:hypothetical protein
MISSVLLVAELPERLLDRFLDGISKAYAVPSTPSNRYTYNLYCKCQIHLIYLRRERALQPSEGRERDAREASAASSRPYGSAPNGRSRQ